MGKIRVRTLGDESQEKEQKKEAKDRRQAKDLKKGKTHVKGVGLKGGQQIKMMEGVELKPEIEAMLHEDSTTLDSSSEEKKVKKKKAVKKVRSKSYKDAFSLIDKQKSYQIDEALALLPKTSYTKFDGTVEVHLNLNPELFTKDKQSLSGTVNLPHGTGKRKRVVIADDSVLKAIEAGKLEFDILVAHPSFMPRLAKFARVLGPKGLMPNPKNDTVSDKPEKRAEELKGGETTWKTEPKNPLIHLSIGKVSFGAEKLKANLTALINSIGTSKISKLTLSSTMGPGIRVDVNSI